jgi:hypothetical protein
MWNCAIADTLKLAYNEIKIEKRARNRDRILHVAREASFEGKAREQSRAGSGGFRVVGDAGERSIPSNNSVAGYADAQR